MRNAFVFLSLALVFALSANAQTMTSTAKTSAASASGSATTSAPKTETTKKRGPVFRANKGQIKEAQTMLKSKGSYSGEATGTLNVDTRTALKGYQKENGLKETGTLNRVTLEKMGIELTDAQKAIPAPAGSSGGSDSKSSTAKSRGPIFRATKDQIAEAQKMLKTGSMYTGDATGKLDDATRAGLKKYQEANGLKVTGKLNQVTLEKMGIALTDKQKETSSSQK
jgi:peptidoglycan hydrolase-like protein with peptidoglycan-binding domain